MIIQLVLLLILLLNTCHAMFPGSDLILDRCDSTSAGTEFVSSRSDGSVRNSDGTLCATYIGASPVQLSMLACVSPLPLTQQWKYNPSNFAFEGTPNGTCLAFNTQGDPSVPTRPVSTWDCYDIEWNGAFFINDNDQIVANCSTQSTCNTDPQYCISTSSSIGRVLSLSTVVRYWTVETTRTSHLLNNESSLHTVDACTSFRNAVATGWPGATITWAFSWDALNAEDGQYPAIRQLVKSYVTLYGDEFTFIPGGYFAPMYNTEEQTNQDIHDALEIISNLVGGGYRPRSIIGGYLGAKTLSYLATVEDIHVAQATIFSQFNIDFGDGDGGSPYPYFPSQEHYLKPSQNESDFIDVVSLDGWTVDFLACRRNGFADGFNSRMGVGPIETIGKFGPIDGFEEQMHATSQHFDTGYALNGEAFVTSIWEISLPIDDIYLTNWLQAVKARWPSAQAITHGEFGLRWRDVHKRNDYNYSFITLGSGIGGSDADKEITFFINPAFRLVLLRNLTDFNVGDAIDFTRYDLYAQEPSIVPDRSWNLMNELNMKQSRGAMDMPRSLSSLSQEDQGIIHKWLPGLPLM